jgi:hypothetical protein
VRKNIQKIDICLKRDILYTCGTQVQMVYKMLEILMFILWGCLTVYVVWYSTLAKHFAPLSPNDARILWKIHKQSVLCSSRKWRVILNGEKIIGFECECGYKHIQKRPIVANKPVRHIETQRSQESALDKLHTTYKSK